MKKKQEIWYKQYFHFFERLLRWLAPGLGVKRWLILILAGTVMIGMGLAFLLFDLDQEVAPKASWLSSSTAKVLQDLDRPLTVIIAFFCGIGVVIWGVGGLNRALMEPYARSGRPVVDTLASYRRRERGPHIVAIGGGHGLATLLRGLKMHSHNITAVVSVADDGGSSGRLRREMGILPPGDIRNCLAALSGEEALLGQLFQYRFGAGDGDLEGHSFGNLFITALAEISGSFEEAVAESGRVLAVHGQVLPATLRDVRLLADVVMPEGSNEVRIQGESKIPESSGEVRRVWLEPPDPPAYPGAIQALLAADLILIGPGSLFTSILPNLLVPDIVAAIRASRALKIYICNVATQPGETDRFTCGDHVRVIEEHAGTDLFDIVVSNDRCDIKPQDGTDWVIAEEDLDIDHAVHRTDLVDVTHPWRHDSEKLAQTLVDLYQERTGPLVE
jgi:uncharacterized cofD-like protein